LAGTSTSLAALRPWLIFRSSRKRASLPLQRLALARAGLNYLAMNTSNHAIDLRDLMSTVGMFLLRWGAIEHQLAGAPIPASLAGVRQMRNTL
jgi:hypothetical protein